MRRIPNFQNYWLVDEEAHSIQVDPYAFTPNKKRDPDGMSFYREDFTTREEVASDNPPQVGARVVRVTVEFLVDLGLGAIIPDPHFEDGRPAGHVYIPSLKYVARNTLTKQEKNDRDKISLALAQHATRNGIWSPSGLSAPVSMA